jgi:CheY-like chemotaxis protein
LPVVAVTACAVAEEERAIRACGVNEVLTKPVNTQRLLATIESFLCVGAHHDEDTGCR